MSNEVAKLIEAEMKAMGLVKDVIVKVNNGTPLHTLAIAHDGEEHTFSLTKNRSVIGILKGNEIFTRIFNGNTPAKNFLFLMVKLTDNSTVLNRIIKRNKFIRSLTRRFTKSRVGINLVDEMEVTMSTCLSSGNDLVIIKTLWDNESYSIETKNISSKDLIPKNWQGSLPYAGDGRREYNRLRRVLSTMSKEKRLKAVS